MIDRGPPTPQILQAVGALVDATEGSAEAALLDAAEKRKAKGQVEPKG